MSSIRIGSGYDAHRLVPDRDLILLGEKIPYEKGLKGHSDADVAVHALMDAILGALALRDIGYHFPDTDDKYKGISSMLLLDRVVKMAKDLGYITGNADITIAAQRPKLKDYIPQMQKNIASALGVELNQVNVKATTTEGMGFEGEGLGISASAVVLMEKII